MKNVKTITILMLVACMLLSLVACNGAPSTTNPTTPTDTTPKTPPLSSPTTTTPSVNLPDTNFDSSLLILGIEHVDYGHIDLFADELNDEAINDAVYNRNSIIYDTLGITITGDLSKNVYKDANTNIGSGFDTYDVYMPPMSDAAKLAKDGYLVDLNELEWLALDKPWWDQNAAESLSMGGKLYFTTGDITILDEELCFVIIFNKTLANELGIDPYKLVDDGDWTIDTLLTIAKEKYLDQGADGFDNDDRWGLLSHSNNSTILYLSTGEKMVAKNENDYPTLGMTTTRANLAIAKALELMLDPHVILDSEIGSMEEELAMTMDGRGLFRSTVLRVARNMRDMQMDFGIIPNPKLDKNQDTYYTPTSASGYLPGVCVPVTNTRLEMTGAALEAMAYYGLQYITPAYKETTLEGIVLKDLESAPMLDLIFSNKVYDLGYIYNFGGITGILNELVLKENPTGFSNALDKIINDINEDIDETVNEYTAA